MSKLKSVSKPKRTTIVNIKVSPEELTKIKQQAEKYADGNMSEWLRYSSMNLKPKKSDMAK